MPSRQTIKKVLNSTVVLVEHDAGVERVLLGKGIGFGHKPGTRWPRTHPPGSSSPCRTTTASTSPSAWPRYRPATSSSPPRTSRWPKRTDSTSTRTSTWPSPDHLHFAAERTRQGLRVANPFTWEMRTPYPGQWTIGVRGAELLRERLGVELPEDEAANVAFHLVNADTGTEHADPMRGLCRES